MTVHALPDIDPFSMPWLNDAACGDMPLDSLNDFFVDAGKAIKPETRAICRRCPVRAECVRHAYTRQIGGGYFGGMSPSQRRAMTLTQALAWIRTDTVEAERSAA